MRVKFGWAWCWGDPAAGENEAQPLLPRRPKGKFRTFVPVVAFIVVLYYTIGNAFANECILRYNELLNTPNTAALSTRFLIVYE